MIRRDCLATFIILLALLMPVLAFFLWIMGLLPRGIDRLTPWPWLGLAIGMILLMILVDWPSLARKHRRWLFIVGILAISFMLYTSGFYMAIPGISTIGVHVDCLLHIKPLAIEIMDARFSKEIPFYFSTEQAKGEFLVISTRITNSGMSPANLLGGFELHDIQGRQFSMDATSFLSSAEMLNPGLSYSPQLVFDVPAARGIWFLTVFSDPIVRRSVTVPVIVM